VGEDSAALVLEEALPDALGLQLKVRCGRPAVLGLESGVERSPVFGGAPLTSGFHRTAGRE
jgi:hypothetical protein